MSLPALYIDDNGFAALVDLATAPTTLAAIQALVDGYVDCVETDPASGLRADVWVNDECLHRQDMGINLIASFLTKRQLVGPVVLANHTAEGDTVALTATNLTRLRVDGLVIADDDGQPYRVDTLVALRRASQVTA